MLREFLILAAGLLGGAKFLLLQGVGYLFVKFIRRACVTARPSGRPKYAVIRGDYGNLSGVREDLYQGDYVLIGRGCLGVYYSYPLKELFCGARLIPLLFPTIKDHGEALVGDEFVAGQEGEEFLPGLFQARPLNSPLQPGDLEDEVVTVNDV